MSRSCRLPSLTLSVILITTAALTAGQSPPPPPTAAQVIDSPWETEWGGFNGIRDLDALSPTDVWAVGSNLVHFDGERWRAVDRREKPALLMAIDMTAPGEGWVVGQEMVVPVRGGALGESQALPGVTLRDVVLLSPVAGWAVGTMRDGEDFRGVVYQLVEGRWQRHTVLDRPRSALDRLWLAGPDEGWAIGGRGELVHFLGQKWSLTEPAVDGWLRAVAIGGTGPDDVWVVGGTEPHPPFIEVNDRRVMWRFDGTTWSKARDEQGTGWSDIALADGRGYAIGYEGALARFEDGRWTDLGRHFDTYSYYHTAVSLSLVPESAEAFVAQSDGKVFHVRGDAETPSNSIADLRAIEMLSPERGWAVGWGPALEFDGRRWSQADPASPLHRIRDIEALGPSGAWAVGLDGLILRWEGQAWREVDSPTDVDLDRVRAIAPDCAWAIGTNHSGMTRGVILRYDGTAWQTVWEQALVQLYELADIDALGPDRAWMLPTGGVLREFDQGRWIDHEIPKGVMSLAVVAPDDIWLGGSGEIYHFDGIEARAVLTFPAGAQIHRIRMLPDGTGFAVGWYGYVMRFDERAWRILRGPADPVAGGGVPYALFDIDTAGTGGETQVWVSGAQNSILRTPLRALEARPAITPAPGETAQPIVILRSQVFLPKLTN